MSGTNNQNTCTDGGNGKGNANRGGIGSTTSYNQQYLAIKHYYDRLPLLEDIDAKISTLDSALKAYQTQTETLTGPAFCYNASGAKIGRSNTNDLSSPGALQIYTEAECARFSNSGWNQNGECIRKGGGSYSWDCRPAGSTSTFSARELTNLKSSFLPISQYYSDLINIKGQLQNFIDSSSSKVIDLETRLESEERYDNRVHPEESVKSRELMYGLLPELRPSTVPILMAAGVFMASISVLMIFQMMGFTGQINLPPALAALPGQLGSTAGNEPLYKNPLILGGLSIVLGAGLIVFAVLYFKAKY
jgi:hypothetical protein